MQRIVIVGGISGIGRALASIYLEAGNRVGIVGRRQNLLDELKNARPEQVCTKQIDVREIDSLIPKLDELVAELGGMDLLIVSSGTGELNPSLVFELERPTIDTNVVGFTAVVDWGYRYFERQGSGHLTAITSLGALTGEGAAPAYGASKAYQVIYLEALRKRAVKAKKRIDMTDIRPGFVDTEMAKGDGLFWVAPVDKAAKQIVSAIRRRRKVAYITKRWRLIGVVLRLMQLAN